MSSQCTFNCLHGLDLDGFISSSQPNPPPHSIHTSFSSHTTLFPPASYFFASRKCSLSLLFTSHPTHQKDIKLKQMKYLTPWLSSSAKTFTLSLHSTEKKVSQKSVSVSWVQFLSRTGILVISCCCYLWPSRYEDSVNFSLPLSNVVICRVKKVVWLLIFLKLSSQPRNPFRYSVSLLYVMVLCFITPTEVPCDMSWWFSHLPPHP
jgi:hypothetical protein